MLGNLLKILTVAREIKDFVVTQGPVALRKVADTINKLEQFVRDAADYVDAVGPTIQFAPGQPGQAFDVGSQQAQEYITQLRSLYSDVSKELSVATVESARVPTGGQAGLLDRLGKMDPATKAAILSIIKSIIEKVLLKSGQTV